MQISLDKRLHTDCAVLALGMFDGVHLGHRVLLQKGKALSGQSGAPLVCGTFTTHPLELVAPEKCPPMLTTMEERAKLMARMGVDILSAEPFDRETRDTPADVYVGQLVRRWHPVHVVVGYNYTFGRKSEGTPALLNALGNALGFETHVVPEIRLDGEEISSTRIRRALEEGDVRLAKRLLGRPYLRDAQAVSKEGAQMSFRLTPNGKLNPLMGKYRGILCKNGISIPVDFCLLRDDTITCANAIEIEPREEAAFLFYDREE